MPLTGSPGVIVQVIKSLMILLLGGGLPALAVAHFGLCSGTSNACRHRVALSHLVSWEHQCAYLPFFSFHSFLKFWVVIIIFLTTEDLVDRQWKEQRKTVKCDSQCIHYHRLRWYMGAKKTLLKQQNLKLGVRDRLCLQLYLKNGAVIQDPF